MDSERTFLQREEEIERVGSVLSDRRLFLRDFPSKERYLTARALRREDQDAREPERLHLLQGGHRARLRELSFHDRRRGHEVDCHPGAGQAVKRPRRDEGFEDG